MLLRYQHLIQNRQRRTVTHTEKDCSLIVSLPVVLEYILATKDHCIRLAQDRLSNRSEIEGLSFHDLRRQGISRLFEAHLSILEVALISGHIDCRVLAQYTCLAAARS